jgi:hypothetical protein
MEPIHIHEVRTTGGSAYTLSYEDPLSSSVPKFAFHEELKKKVIVIGML